MSTRILLLLLVIVCVNTLEFSEEQQPDIGPLQDAIFCKDTMEQNNPTEERTKLKDMWEEVQVRARAPTADKQTLPK